MDVDYARLSLLAGFFAAAADAYLRHEHFTPLVRAHVWDLTQERLAAWKEEATQMGVPAEAMELSEEEQAPLLAIAINMQAAVDRDS